jgi:hypothetical protein
LQTKNDKGTRYSYGQVRALRVQSEATIKGAHGGSIERQAGSGEGAVRTVKKKERGFIGNRRIGDVEQGIERFAAGMSAAIQE